MFKHTIFKPFGNLIYPNIQSLTISELGWIEHCRTKSGICSNSDVGSYVEMPYLRIPEGYDCMVSSMIRFRGIPRYPKPVKISPRGGFGGGGGPDWGGVQKYRKWSKIIDFSHFLMLFDDFGWGGVPIGWGGVQMVTFYPRNPVLPPPGGVLRVPV
jgi:hypothetical protein